MLYAISHIGDLLEFFKCECFFSVCDAMRFYVTISLFGHFNSLEGVSYHSSHDATSLKE